MLISTKEKGIKLINSLTRKAEIFIRTNLNPSKHGIVFAFYSKCLEATHTWKFLTLHTFLLRMQKNEEKKSTNLFLPPPNALWKIGPKNRPCSNDEDLLKACQVYSSALRDLEKKNTKSPVHIYQVRIVSKLVTTFGHTVYE